MIEVTERCMCGAAVIDANAPHPDGEPVVERWSWWVHAPGSDTRCAKVHRVSEVMPDRALIEAAAAQMAELSNRTRRAAGEFERFQSLMAEVLDESRELKAALDQPHTIERATLGKVWNRLMRGNEIAAAMLVSEMMRDLK